MTENNKLSATIKIPGGCAFNRDGKTITIKGPKGELVRKLADNKIKTTQEANILSVEYAKSTKREKAQLFTTRAHIRNMFKGVTQGYVYKLKICSGHFPMSVSLKDKQLEIKNFIGEAVPRKLTLKEDVSVKIDGDSITVESIDKEKAGQCAASIEKLTRRPGFDKRIFQDGIYIIEKDGKKL